MATSVLAGAGRRVGAAVCYRLTFPPPAITAIFGRMNLVADLGAVQERIEQTQDRIFRQEAVIRRLRQINAPSCLLDAAERLRDALRRDMQAMIAHRDGILTTLDKFSGGVLGAMQTGLSQPHIEVDDLPTLLTRTSMPVADFKASNS